MSSVFAQDPAVILDHYADVIEGGNAYAGGSSYDGIPGPHSNDRHLRSGDDTPLTVAGGVALSTTTFDAAAAKSWHPDRWVTDNGPAFWALCTTSGEAGSPNLHRARKITGYNDTTKVFTTGSAFPSTPIATDVMTILQGYKRLPNGADIEDEEVEVEDGFDRSFHLSAAPGMITDHHGDHLVTYLTELKLRIRLQKFGRLHDWTAAALACLSTMRPAITKASHYDGTYVRALIAKGDQQAEVLKDDQFKIVVEDSYTLIYRIDGTYL